MKAASVDLFLVDAHLPDYITMHRQYVAAGLCHKVVSYGARGGEKDAIKALGQENVNYVLSGVWWSAQLAEQARPVARSSWTRSRRSTAAARRSGSRRSATRARARCSHAIQQAGTVDREAVREKLAAMKMPSLLPGGTLEFKAEFGQQAQNPFVVQQNQPDGTSPIIYPKDVASAPGVAREPALREVIAMARFVDLAISAMLLAGLYATMAYGLGLIYGVLRVVNLAHGGVIMAGAYLGWVLHGWLGLDPYLSIPIVVGVTFALGVVMYRLLVRHLPRGAAGGPASLLLLFGVWLVLRNVAYLLFTGNDQTIRTAYSTRALPLLGSYVSVNRLAVLGIAVVTPVLLHLLLRRTYLGRAIRAVAQNADSCTLVGIDVERIYTITFGIGTALAGLAGLLSATIFSFNPGFGAGELLKSFVVVVLGGLGSVFGTGVAALILAVVEVFAILVLPSYLTAAVGFVMLVLVLVLRPGGLFGQRVLG